MAGRPQLRGAGGSGGTAAGCNPRRGGMIDFNLAFIDTPGHFLVGVNGPEIGETPEPLPPTSKKRLFLRATAARAAMAPFSAPEALAEAGRDLFDELIRGRNRELYRRAREKAE